MNSIERRFRVTLTPDPEKPGEVEFARHDPRWPWFDVIDPPEWLADTAGKTMRREFFDSVRGVLLREGYEFSPQRNAWIFAKARKLGFGYSAHPMHGSEG